MTLTTEQLRLRDGKVTASFVPSLMAGDEAKILNEWRRLVDDPDYAEEDLTNNWPVQFGSYIEDFALDWHQRKTGRVLTRRREVVTHPRKPHVCCTLDAYRADDFTVIDCKASGAWRKLDDVIALYTPQLIVQKACAEAIRAALLIVHGGAEPVEHAISWELTYEAQVWDRIEWFWDCVQSLTPPVAIAPAAAPMLITQWRQFDLDALEANNEVWPNWAYAMQGPLATWALTCGKAKENARATKEIKELLPEDVNRLTYSGVVITRVKNGAVSIKEA